MQLHKRMFMLFLVLVFVIPWKYCGAIANAAAATPQTIDVNEDFPNQHINSTQVPSDFGPIIIDLGVRLHYQDTHYLLPFWYMICTHSSTSYYPYSCEFWFKGNMYNYYLIHKYGLEEGQCLTEDDDVPRVCLENNMVNVASDQNKIFQGLEFVIFIPRITK